MSALQGGDRLRFASFLAPNMLPVYTFMVNRIGQRLNTSVSLAVGDCYDELAGQIDAAFICGLAYLELNRHGLADLEPVPLAGTTYGSGIWTIASGVPISHPAGYSGRGGRFFGSPGFAPESTQRMIMSRSWSVRRRSLRNTPRGPAACHGGMRADATMPLIFLIFGAALS